MAKKFTIRKFDGDDKYSWAVFRSDDLKRIPGRQNVIFYGQAKPLVCGMSRMDAVHTRDRMEREKK
jgi:hypothetical protein